MPDRADVTVVMPALNRAHLIGRALDSVQAQTLRPAEVVVIDDGSTDGTAEVARSRGARVIELPESGGSGPARNRGIETAGTTWIAFLDSDDEWLPDHLARVTRRTGGNVLVTAPGRTTAGRIMGNPWGRYLSLDPITLLAPGDVICTSGTLVRRDVLLDVGMFRPLRRAQDLDLWLRVLAQGPGLALPEASVIYHEHATQASKDSALMRQCFDRIVEDLRERDALSGKDVDRCYSRVRWDDFRAAQRGGDVPAALTHATWIAARPHAWPPLLRLLRQRRLSRAG